MTTYYGVLYRGGSHRCFTSADGIQKVEVGCSHRVPRDAIDHSNALVARASRSDSALSPLSGGDPGCDKNGEPDNGFSGVPALSPTPGVRAAGAVPPAPAAPDNDTLGL